MARLSFAAALLALGLGCGTSPATKNPDQEMPQEITKDLGNFCESIHREFGDVEFTTSGDDLPYWEDKTREVGLDGLEAPSVAVGYINNDNIPDVFVGSGDSYQIFLGCADRPHGTKLQFQRAVLLSRGFNQEALPNGYVMSSIIGDLDQDNLADIVYGMTDGRVIALYNKGYGQFHPEVLVTVNGSSRIRTLTLYDLNKDTLVDLLIAVEGGNGMQQREPLPNLKNYLLLNQGDSFRDVTDNEEALLEPGMFPTFSQLILPYAALRGDRGDCLVIGNDLAKDYIFCANRNRKIPNTEITFPQPSSPNATMGLDYLIHPDGKTIYVAFSNTGKPMLVEIDENMNIQNVSDGIPMRTAGNINDIPDNILDIPDRDRVGWGILLGNEYDAQARMSLLVVNGGDGHHQAAFPGSQGAAIYLADAFNPGTVPQFKALHRQAGEQFDPTAVENNYSVAKIYGPNGCPNLIITGYQQNGGRSTPIRYLEHNCAGRRSGFRLIPEDYGAVINVEYNDGTQDFVTLKQPFVASGNQPVAVLGIADKEPVRAEITWGDGDRTILDSVSSSDFNVVHRDDQ